MKTNTYLTQYNNNNKKLAKWGLVWLSKLLDDEILAGGWNKQKGLLLWYKHWNIKHSHSTVAGKCHPSNLYFVFFIIHLPFSITRFQITCSPAWAAHDWITLRLMRGNDAHRKKTCVEPWGPIFLRPAGWRCWHPSLTFYRSGCPNNRECSMPIY